MLSNQTIEDLRQIVREDYGREITEAEASQTASMLIGYFDLLAKIHHRNKHENDNATNK